MAINKESSENIKISFSAKYMMEALKTFKSEEIEIKFVGEVKPILINGEEEEGLTQLILPIRTY